MKNIFYFSHINSIGGVETFFYYMAKKYQDWDITIYYKTGNPEQINRLRKYVRVMQFNGQKIECEKAFFNYNTDIIDYVEAKEYIQIVHNDVRYKKKKFVVNPKITKFVGVSQLVCDAFKKEVGIDIECIYNPLAFEKPKKVLNLISATRLTAEKGKERIEKFAKILEQQGIPYLWTIFTNDTKVINNPNIIYMQPKMDVVNYIANTGKSGGYLVQLSDTEAYGFSVVEALSVGCPVIVTDCPVFKEIGIIDKKNGFIIDFDMKNVPISEIYKGLPKFEYTAPEDSWDKFLAKGKSEYKENMKKNIMVQCIKKYNDIERSFKNS